MTDLEKALILAKGATARHAKSAHLWRKAVRMTAKELEAELRRANAPPCKPLPLFDHQKGNHHA